MAYKNRPAENKLQISFSPLAERIISDDMYTFGESKKGTFLNKVFIAFHADADASISIQMEKEREKLIAYGLPNDSEVIKVRCEIIKNENLSVAERYPSGGPVTRFYVQKPVMDFLCGEGPLDGYPCMEDAYFPHMSRYFKAVIEEYTRKSYFQRERIYRREIFDILEAETDKAESHFVTLNMLNGRKHKVAPYRIEPDAQSLYHYLIARTYDTRRWISYRISKISSVVVYEKRAFFSEDEKKKADNAILERGVQFLSSEPTEVRVRLTKAGEKRYQEQFHLQPQVEKIETDEKGAIYIFHCTATQAEFYFFKFGADAQILKPDSLAEQFQKKYQEACEIYRNCSKDYQE